MSTIYRTIHFIRTDLMLVGGDPPPSQGELFTALQGAPVSERIILRGEQQDRIRIDRVLNGLVLGTLHRSRRTDLPTTEDSGEFEAPIPLNPDERLSEACHWIWADFSHCKPLPSTTNPARFGVMVCEYNHRGPRWRNVVQHLSQLFHETHILHAGPIVEPDRWAEVMAADGLGTIDASFRRKREKKTRELQAWECDELDGITDDEVMRVGLTLGPAQRQRFTPAAMAARLRNWMASPTITHLRVDIGRPTGPVDLVEQALKKRTTVARQDEYMRAVDRDDMFRQIVKAFESEREGIAQSMGYKWAPLP